MVYGAEMLPLCIIVTIIIIYCYCQSGLPSGWAKGETDITKYVIDQAS